MNKPTLSQPNHRSKNTPEFRARKKAQRRSRPLRVLITTHLAECSGAPLVATQIAQNLDPKEFHCVVALPCKGGIEKHLRDKNIHFHAFDLIPCAFRETQTASEKARWFISRLKYAKSLYQMTRRERPDVVYIHSSAQILPGLIARIARIPIVWHIHETWDTPATRLGFRKWPTIKRLADALIFCGWSARKKFGKRSKNQQWCVIPNAIQRDVFETLPISKNARKNLGFPEDAFLLLTVGAIHRRKGLDVLLKAAPLIVQQSSKPIFLLIAGAFHDSQPEYRREIETLVRRENLQDHTRFLGFREDIPALLAASDLFVLPSRAEALPLTILEAFAAGTPVVATDVGDCQRLIGANERGLCIPSKNPEALADAIFTLLENPKQRDKMAKKARRFASERFDFSRWIKAISKILEDTAHV